MKAPDKIYVHTGAHLGLLTLTTIPVGGPAEQEFIRKDVLINWLKEHINDYLVHGRDIDLMFDDIKNAF